MAVRSVVVTLGLLVGAVFGWASGASAHGGATVTVHSDGRGSVWVTAVWADGHPVGEPMRVTLAASGPASVGPDVLRATGDQQGTQTWSGTLLPGTWRVSVDLGAPVGGHCQAVVPVAAERPSVDESSADEPSAGAVEVACLISGSAPPAEASGLTASPVVWGTLGGVLVAAGALAVVVRRRARV